MDFIESLKVILFGIIEGITEWLPISSTGHLILLEELLPLKISPEVWDLFLVVIQLGAIMAVVVLFWNKLFPFRFSRGPLIKKDIMMMWFKVVVATLPAIVIALPFDDLIHSLFYKPIPIAAMLILYGVIFILVENRNRRRRYRVQSIEDLSFQMAFFIGVFQVLALMPGTSRSGATIIGAMLIGATRSVAAEFTFFLAIPAMFGASVLKIAKFDAAFTGSDALILAIGMLSAFVVSIVVIQFLMQYIKKHDFKIFGYYRILLGIVVILYFTVMKRGF